MSSDTTMCKCPCPSLSAGQSEGGVLHSYMTCRQLDFPLNHTQVNYEFLRMRGDLEETHKELKRVQVCADRGSLYDSNIILWVEAECLLQSKRMKACKEREPRRLWCVCPFTSLCSCKNLSCFNNNRSEGQNNLLFLGYIMKQRLVNCGQGISTKHWELHEVCEVPNWKCGSKGFFGRSSYWHKCTHTHT